jgi:hypothetical protein
VPYVRNDYFIGMSNKITQGLAELLKAKGITAQEMKDFNVSVSVPATNEGRVVANASKLAQSNDKAVAKDGERILELIQDSSREKELNSLIRKHEGEMVFTKPLKNAETGEIEETETLPQLKDNFESRKV